MSLIIANIKNRWMSSETPLTKLEVALLFSRIEELEEKLTTQQGAQTDETLPPHKHFYVDGYCACGHVLSHYPHA